MNRASRVYRFIRRFFANVSVGLVAGYAWRLLLWFIVFASPLTLIERIVAQADRGYQASTPVFVGIAFGAVVASGCAVYVQRVAVERERFNVAQLRAAKTEKDLRQDLAVVTSKLDAKSSAYSELELVVKAERDKRPNVIFGLAGGTRGFPDQSMTVRLVEPAQEPGFDALVAEHLEDVSDELNRPPSWDEIDMGGLVYVTGQPNPNYEAEAAQYPEEYRAFVQRVFRFYLAQNGWLLELSPIAVNRGNASADSVTIVLRFPGHVRPAILEEKLWWRYGFDHPPSKPSLPARLVSALHDSAAILAGLNAGTQYQDPPERSIDGPFLDDQDHPTAATYTADLIVQGGLPVVFDPLLVWLGDLRQSAIVEIDVEVYSASEPASEPKRSKLTLDCQIEVAAYETDDDLQ